MSYPQGAELVVVIVFAIIAGILLSLGLYHFFTQFSSKKTYSVTFNGKRTYNDYPVSAFIDDFQRINVFEPNNMSQPYVIPLTHMIGQEASINSANINYTISLKPSPHNQTELLIIQVNANSTTPGQFEGLIMISEGNNNTHISIPITLRSNVMTFNAIIWILVGIFASFIFWELMKANQKERVKGKLKSFKEETNTFDKINHPGVAENLVQRIKHERIYEYLESRFKTGSVAGKIVFVDIMSVIFGIAVGLIGLLNNDFVTNILVMTPQSIVILFGTGLAIGSIKELVDKPD